MSSDSNKLPAPLQVAISLTILLGVLHGLVGLSIALTVASNNPWGSAPLVISTIVGLCFIAAAAAYFLMAAKMEARRRWAVIATLVISVCETGLTGLFVAAVLFGGRLADDGIVALLLAVTAFALILRTMRALRHWDDIAPRQGFAVLPPSAPPAAKLPADAADDQRTEP